MKFNERQAHMALVQTIEQNKQDDLRAMNKKTIDDESERKESVNMQFWRNVWVSANTLGLMIIIYTLFHFM